MSFWGDVKQLPSELLLSLVLDDPYWSLPGRFEIAAFVKERIGHIRVEREGDLWIVEGVGVNRIHRQGIGTALYKAAYKEAEKRGGRLASVCRMTTYARNFWAKQLREGRAEVLAPARFGSEEERALLAACPGFLAEEESESVHDRG